MYLSHKIIKIITSTLTLTIYSIAVTQSQKQCGGQFKGKYPVKACSILLSLRSKLSRLRKKYGRNEEILQDDHNPFKNQSKGIIWRHHNTVEIMTSIWVPGVSLLIRHRIDCRLLILSFVSIFIHSFRVALQFSESRSSSRY